MERCAGADPVRARPRGAHRDRAAHAVSHRTHLAIRIDGRLGVEEVDEGPRIGDVGFGVECARERNHRVPDGLVLKGRAFGHDRRARRAVEGVDHEHRVARFGEAPAHLPERRAQAQNVGPDHDTGMSSGSGMHEKAVRDPIGGGDFDVLLGDSLRIGRARQEHRKPGPGREGPEITPGQFALAVQKFAGFPECLDRRT